MKKVLFLIFLTFAFSLFSYVVYLKDGSTYMAKEKYKVENGKAIITLTNGTIISIDLNLIDVKKTEKMNKKGIDSAIILESEKKESPIAAAAKPSLGDIAKQLNPNIPTTIKSPSKTKGQDKKTKEGEKPYDDEVVRKAIGSVLDNVYLFEHNILQGETPDSVKIIVITDNEKDVFNSLSAITKAATELYDKGKKSINKLEIYLKTTAGAPAGRFIIDIEEARTLAEGKITPPQFFIKYILF